MLLKTLQHSRYCTCYCCRYNCSCQLHCNRTSWNKWFKLQTWELCIVLACLVGSVTSHLVSMLHPVCRGSAANCVTVTMHCLVRGSVRGRQPPRGRAQKTAPRSPLPSDCHSTYSMTDQTPVLWQHPLFWVVRGRV